jgi:uncharacterized protein YbjQ (UPF0145 family)
MVTITKVVSRNFIIDWIAKWQNLVGGNLTPYEKMINKGIEQVQKEVKEKGLKLKWYRYEITQLTNGAVAILFYGDE